jgi:hypothetical protein
MPPKLRDQQGNLLDMDEAERRLQTNAMQFMNSQMAMEGQVHARIGSVNLHVRIEISFNLNSIKDGLFERP